LVELRKANTMTVKDVLYALRLAGRPMWGFGDASPPSVRRIAC
jgi:hypothetical protein